MDSPSKIQKILVVGFTYFLVQDVSSLEDGSRLSYCVRQKTPDMDSLHRLHRFAAEVAFGWCLWGIVPALWWAAFSGVPVGPDKTADSAEWWMAAAFCLIVGWDMLGWWFPGISFKGWNDHPDMNEKINVTLQMTLYEAVRTDTIWRF